MEIDTLEAIQAGGATQWIRIRGADASNPVLLLIQQGPGLPMINESAPLRAPPRAGTSLHRRLLGPARLRSLAAQTRGPGRHQPGARWQATRCCSWNFLRHRFGGKTYVAGFSFGGTVGAARRRTAPGPGRDAGGGGNGHRRRRRRHQPPTTSRSAPPASVASRRATRQLAGHRPAPAPQLASSSPPGSAGRPTSAGSRAVKPTPPWRADCSPAWSAHPITRPGTSSGPSAVSARHRPRCCPSWPPWTWLATLPRLDVPVVMVQGRHDQVAPGRCRTAVRRLPAGAGQAPGVVRQLSAHATSGGTRQVPGPPDGNPGARDETGCHHGRRATTTRRSYERGTLLDDLYGAGFALTIPNTARIDTIPAGARRPRALVRGEARKLTDRRAGVPAPWLRADAGVPSPAWGVPSLASTAPVRRARTSPMAGSWLAGSGNGMCAWIW